MVKLFIFILFGLFQFQVSYHPQPGRSINEPDYSRIRSRSEAGVMDNYSTASVITDSTLAMKRELDDSDAASAVTLPQSRPRPDDASGQNKMQPLINRYDKKGKTCIKFISLTQNVECLQATNDYAFANAAGNEFRYGSTGSAATRSHHRLLGLIQRKFLLTPSV
jgi:hypothetical protein